MWQVSVTSNSHCESIVANVASKCYELLKQHKCLGRAELANRSKTKSIDYGSQSLMVPNHLPVTVIDYFSEQQLNDHTIYVAKTSVAEDVTAQEASMLLQTSVALKEASTLFQTSVAEEVTAQEASALLQKSVAENLTGRRHVRYFGRKCLISRAHQTRRRRRCFKRPWLRK